MGVKALMIVLLCAGLAASQSTVPSTTKATDPQTTKATAPPTNPPTTKATDPSTTKDTTPATTQPPTTKSTTPATTQPPTTKPTTPTTTKVPTTKPTTPTTTKAPTTKPTTPTTTKAPTTKPTTPTTTEAPTTKPTTPTTTKAPTTKPTTPTTTKAPTTKPTTPATTKPTTAEPTTKPTAPATTKVPTAPPVPPVPHYDVKDNGTVCIRVQGEMNFTVPYKSNSSAAKVTFAVPASAIASGSCFGVNKTTASVSLSWAKGLATFTLGFNMMKDGSWGTASMNYNFSTANPVFVLPIDNPPFIAGGLKKGADLKMYHATKGHSYQCDREEDVSLENDVVISFANLQMQPLKLNGGKFNDADVCPKKTDDNSTSSIVPIAVGCALAGLIVIVLIAYLVGRRRGNRGYQQV